VKSGNPPVVTRNGFKVPPYKGWRNEVCFHQNLPVFFLRDFLKHGDCYLLSPTQGGDLASTSINPDVALRHSFIFCVCCSQSLSRRMFRAEACGPQPRSQRWADYSVGDDQQRGCKMSKKQRINCLSFKTPYIHSTLLKS